MRLGARRPGEDGRLGISGGTNALASATSVASFAVIATRPSTSTTGMSASAAAASSNSGQSPRAAQYTDARRREGCQGRFSVPTEIGHWVASRGSVDSVSDASFALKPAVPRGIQQTGEFQPQTASGTRAGLRGAADSAETCLRRERLTDAAGVSVGRAQYPSG